MKKFSYLLIIMFLCIMFFSSAKADYTDKQIANIRSSYQTYVNRLRTCSPYTHNIDGDGIIWKTEGIYNRRCVVRFYTFDSTFDCSLKKDELKTFVKSLPSPKVYIAKNEDIGKMSGAESDKALEDRASFIFQLMKSTLNDSCKINGEASRENG